MAITLESVIAHFGQSVLQKLRSPIVSGQPEDQLRAPFERLLLDIAALLQISDVIPIGESSVQDLKTRPDYAVTVQQTLVGFIELKAPGKGADPRKFKDKHDKAQWSKLQALPNLIYSDGNSFSLWQDGELVGEIIAFATDIEAAGRKLRPPAGLLDLFQAFFLWQPIAPGTAKELASVSARLCRLLRDEVTEQLAQGSEALTALATDWRKLLFPEATDERFADGYAQAVTFGLLLARAQGIGLAQGFEQISLELKISHSLIGAALRLLTENPENQATLKTSLRALTHVLDAVDWPTISKGDSETWLYFYEDFLEVYDSNLRKKTGSYYTPPEVVDSMVRLVDEALKSQEFGLNAGLAAPEVTIVDPATGTGTYVLGILKHIAAYIQADQGAGAVPGAIETALQRLIAFELQLGPFAVAQLRILAEVMALTGATPRTEPRMFVTDTLSDPDDDAGWIPSILAPIAKSRQDSNKIKREEPVTVVIGNPPYRERAKGCGGWIESGNRQVMESGNRQTKAKSPLLDWMPPKEWGVSTHAKHLRNFYIYFWRWATWKVFDRHPEQRSGIICFITVAGFLSGPGFQRMREYLRQSCSQIWVIDCSPEGYQPEVKTRIFQDVQQPVCIVLASRSRQKPEQAIAAVKFQSLSKGNRRQKFKELQKLTLQGKGWLDCPADLRAPFLPKSRKAWATYPALADFFSYHGSGVMPGRTWVIAPDSASLAQRWNTLTNAPNEQKENLFHPHGSGDRHVKKVIQDPLGNHPVRAASVADDRSEVISPTCYGYRSFDRQWIIPDKRLINRPNPRLWANHSEKQIYLTAFLAESPKSGPALTVTALIPDLHHYKGSFGGRVFPLWGNAQATRSNIKAHVLSCLTQTYGIPVHSPDLFAYIAAIAAQPHFTARFQRDLATPGIRIPLTADPGLFQEAVTIGQQVIWLHTFGERMVDPAQGRPAGPPRLPAEQRPLIPQAGAIPADPEGMPDEIGYDPEKQRLLLGTAYIDRVPVAVWNYEVSEKQTILHWFSYRKKNRERPIIGDRRPPSPLDRIYPDTWLPEYTTELINLLNVLGLLVALAPQQASLLDRICAGSLLAQQTLQAASSTASSSSSSSAFSHNPDQMSLQF